MTERNPGSVGRKDDGGKLRFDLVPWRALREVVAVLTVGGAKYGAHNWIFVPEARERYFAALQRHVGAWWTGEANDPDDGLHHLAHALCCGFFLLAFEVDPEVARRRAERALERVEAPGPSVPTPGAGKPLPYAFAFPNAARRDIDMPRRFVTETGGAGVYFPSTDLSVSAMGGRGTGMPEGVRWVDDVSDLPWAPSSRA